MIVVFKLLFSLLITQKQLPNAQNMQQKDGEKKSLVRKRASKQKRMKKDHNLFVFVSITSGSVQDIFLLYHILL